MSRTQAADLDNIEEEIRTAEEEAERTQGQESSYPPSYQNIPYKLYAAPMEKAIKVKAEIKRA